MTAARRTKAEHPDLVLAHDPDQGDLDRAAAVSRVARRKGTVPPPLAAIRRECIFRVRSTGVVLGVIADRIGVSVPRVIQLLAEHRMRQGADHAVPR
jgi:hypothetical protein